MRGLVKEPDEFSGDEVMAPRCRWCSDDLDLEGECSNCGATSGAFGFHEGDSQRGFEFYMNPDGSIYLEFIKPDGKTSRITLSAEFLQHLGVLETFDQPPKGFRTPQKPSPGHLRSL